MSTSTYSPRTILRAVWPVALLLVLIGVFLGGFVLFIDLPKFIQAHDPAPVAVLAPDKHAELIAYLEDLRVAGLAASAVPEEFHETLSFVERGGWAFDSGHVLLAEATRLDAVAAGFAAMHPIDTESKQARAAMISHTRNIATYLRALESTREIALISSVANETEFLVDAILGEVERIKQLEIMAGLPD
jgi:hypothetical protein